MEKIIQNKINNILENTSHKLNLNINLVDTLVLSGGGARGLYYIGIFKKLEEKSILEKINNYAGSSIGAFFCVLLNIGYNTKELIDFFLLFNLDKIKKLTPSNFLTNLGLDEGKHFEFVLEKMFEIKKINKNITFKELYTKTKKELFITGVCINEKKCHYFSHKTTPNMQIIMAIRISTAMPIYFAPVKYNNKLWIDGGIINNYPIDIFRNNLNKVLGIYLQEKFEYTSINNLEDYLVCLIQSLHEGYSLKAINGFENNTIVIKSEENVISNNITKEKILEYINTGYIEIANKILFI